MNLNLVFLRVNMIISDFVGFFTFAAGFVNSFCNVSKKFNFLDVPGIAFNFVLGLNGSIVTGEDAAAVKYIVNKSLNLRIYIPIKSKLCYAANTTLLCF